MEQPLKTHLLKLMPNPERASDMIRRHEAGESAASIGRSYGISRQRASFIIRQYWSRARKPRMFKIEEGEC
jgi:hypothetical protein